MKTYNAIALIVAAMLLVASCTKHAETDTALTTDQAMELQRTTAPNGEISQTFDGIEFVWIPPGSFMMGSRLSARKLAGKYGGIPSDYDDEYPQHEVTISKGFWMSKYEVTNAQYRECEPDHSSKEYKGHDLNGDSQPVVEVSWHEATGYCWWLSKRSDATYRLPTEAEWEYACRAGTSTPRYWGDDDVSMGRYANVYDVTAKAKINMFFDPADTTDGYGVSSPVGSFEANAWGLHDMIGNAYELCADLHEDYSSASATDPKGADSGTECIMRGSSWWYLPRYSRSTSRNWTFQTTKLFDRGFRICRSAGE